MNFVLFIIALLQVVPPVWGDHAGSPFPQRDRILSDWRHTKSGRDIQLKRASRDLTTRRNAEAVVVGASPCTGGFEKPSYQIVGFQFNKTTIEVGERSMTRFQLHDIVNNGSISCTTPYLQDPNKPAWNGCDDNHDDGISPKTMFKYSAAGTELEISQMWICEVQNKTHPLPYFSTAKTDFKGQLKCVEDFSQTRCTIEDDTTTPFGGDYITPVWKSDAVDIIPPSQSAIPETPWNPTPCIGPSFSYPNWDVQDFSSETTDGEIFVSFRLNNHAGNETVSCTVKEGEWLSCDNKLTVVRFIQETKELSVNQTWVCNGGDQYPEDVTFRAVGSATVDTEFTNAIIVKGSLIEPIEMTPNVAPQGVNHPGCLEVSEKPSWIVASWVWNEIWSNGYNHGNLTATFYNPGTGFNLTCTGDGEELNRDGRYGYDRWWGCALDRSPFEDYRIFSSIKLNPLTEVFSINQEWYCNGQDDKLPAGFTAVGDVDTNLECSWNNNTSTNTTIKTCYQTELPFTVYGNVTKQTELPKDVFFELAPTGYSCTIASVLATQWRPSWSSDAVYAGPTFADTFKTREYSAITFMALDGYQHVDYTNVSLTPFLPTSDPGRWYDCKDYETGEESSSIWARQSIDCKWQLDLATGYFAINHTWYCDDKDSENPIIFRGAGSRFYDFSCYIYRDDDQISCNPTGLNPPTVLPTYLSWKSVPVTEIRT
ncbi:hypothetical protein GGR54DRAFT_592688 [Hypoxylon sp. NC1633]|nr:hypothetical protein GGR54DRAFT_592688 [Hypoxylon sp. NC1633]